MPLELFKFLVFHAVVSFCYLSLLVTSVHINVCRIFATKHQSMVTYGGPARSLRHLFSPPRHLVAGARNDRADETSIMATAALFTLFLLSITCTKRGGINQWISQLTRSSQACWFTGRSEWPSFSFVFIITDKYETLSDFKMWPPPPPPIANSSWILCTLFPNFL